MTSPTAQGAPSTPEQNSAILQNSTAPSWRPFLPVVRPTVPDAFTAPWSRHPIDAFIARQHQARGLHPRPEADRATLLRRVHLDLIGLSPTPEEQDDFARDADPLAYEKVVDRLLDDPRYGERWARHWMDIWRYSDWAGWSGGNQIRDSKPHIWRWRDWIVESLNADKGYDRMVVEMLAGDEAAPEDELALRATGYLVRNFKSLSREQWLEDTVKHTAQAFLGLTLGCAKCHDHRADPISQADYFALRAVFEPHHVRTDRRPGELDIARDGLVRVYDKELEAMTYLFMRGDERSPDTNQVLKPGVPPLLGSGLAVKPVDLPYYAAHPDERPFVLADLMAEREDALRKASASWEQAKAQASESEDDAASRDRVRIASWAMDAAEAERDALARTLAVEGLERDGAQGTDKWNTAALAASTAQQRRALARSEHRWQSARRAETAAHAKVRNAKNESQRAKAQAALEEARKATADAAASLAKAEADRDAGPTTGYEPRKRESFPETSTGRRLALARWMTDTNNPLTARVAVNHVWLRHFGRGLVPTPTDFGGNGRPPSHPALLDWLASELMANGWRMKPLHRAVVTSGVYRMASTGDASNESLDPDNAFLWRAPARRMEAELVRDNLLHTAGELEVTMGGPDIDETLGLKSKRRSLYLRLAAEKEVEFLRVFDGPNVTECYERHATVVPQQALALANSSLTRAQARLLAGRIGVAAGADDAAFVRQAYRAVLAREPNPEETLACETFLAARKAEQTPGRGREHLVQVLYNHNDFISIR